MKRERFLGVTVLPEYVQSKAIGGVLDNLVEKVGANAVATSSLLSSSFDLSHTRREHRTSCTADVRPLRTR